MYLYASVCIKYRGRRYEPILHNRDTEDARALHASKSGALRQGGPKPLQGVRNTRPASSFYTALSLTASKLQGTARLRNKEYNLKYVSTWALGFKRGTANITGMVTCNIRPRSGNTRQVSNSVTCGILVDIESIKNSKLYERIILTKTSTRFITCNDVRPALTVKLTRLVNMLFV
jgi:hypothetical protein